MSIETLKTARSSAPQETAAFLRNLADKADAGEIVSVTCVTEHPDGCYTVTGTAVMDRRKTMGTLLEAALMRSA